MSKNLITKLVTAVCGLCLVFASPAYSRTQTVPSTSAQTPRRTLPPTQSRRAASPMDDFTDLQLTEDQMVKMRHIQDDFNSRLNAVANDNALDTDQKNAFLEGFQRMEYREIYTNVLIPEQQAAVRKKAATRRAAGTARETEASTPKGL